MGAHEFSTSGSWTGDLDGDGLTDLAEIANNTHLLIADTDGDRMNDGYEVGNGLDPLTDDRYRDPDGDGFPNLAEYLKSTSAGSDTSMPTADRVVGAGETYTTISAALASLTADDQIIIVKPGVYPEIVNNAVSNNSLNKRVFIIAEALDPSMTFIRAAPGIHGAVQSKKDIYLGGFTIDAVRQDGVRLSGSGTHAISRCILKGHKAGISVIASSSAEMNIVEISNSLISDGASYAIYATTPVDFRLAHSTLAKISTGTADGPGVMVSCSGSGHSGTVLNSIVWGGVGTQIAGVGTLSVNYSCVRGASAPAGTANTNADPRLNQGRLELGSSCLNIGTVLPWIAKDIDLNARVYGSLPDAGCHEFQRQVPAGSPTAGYLAGLDLSAGSGDFDGDGVMDAVELMMGTDPLIADTDGDGVGDGTDRFPLDPAAAGTAGGPDTTAPVVTISQPSGAMKL